MLNLLMKKGISAKPTDKKVFFKTFLQKQAISGQELKNQIKSNSHSMFRLFRPLP